jgi:hypothetical protein
MMVPMTRMDEHRQPVDQAQHCCHEKSAFHDINLSKPSMADR